MNIIGTDYNGNESLGIISVKNEKYTWFGVLKAIHTNHRIVFDDHIRKVFPE